MGGGGEGGDGGGVRTPILDKIITVVREAGKPHATPGLSTGWRGQDGGLRDQKIRTKIVLAD